MANFEDGIKKGFICNLGHPLIQSGKDQGFCSMIECPESRRNAMQTFGMDKTRLYFGVPGYLISFKESTNEVSVQCHKCKKWHPITGQRKEYLETLIHIFMVGVANLPLV